MDEVTAEQVMEAVVALRTEVESKSMNPEVVDRIQTFLDDAETKNQRLVQAEQLAIQHVEDIKELKAKLEATGLTEAEAKGRIDALEAEIARGIQSAGTADYKESEEYKALNHFCKVGMNGLDAEQKVLLRTDSMIDGGILTTIEMDTAITKQITEIDPLRSVCRVRTISAKSMELPVRTGIPTATYEGEAETGADSASTYGSETVTPYRQTYTAPITIDMLQDAAFDMESEIAGDAAEAFAFGEGNGFVVGPGLKTPAGFTLDTRLQANKRESAASGVLDPDAIILLTGDLKVGYNPVYVMNRRTLALIRTFVATTNQYLWQPGLSGPVANTINGFPYILANSMPDVGSSAYAMAFGDFRRGYTIVDRTGMTVVRDEFTLKKKAIVEFTMNRWNTGQVTLPEAIKLLMIKA